MSDPVVEKIAANIKAAINAITEANGFSQDLVAVRPTRLGFEDNAVPGDLKVVIVQEDPEENEELSAEGNPAMKAWTQPFALVCFVISSDTAVVGIDTRLNQVRSDVEKKLMEDVTRGGQAIDTRLGGSMRFSEGPNASGIIVVVNVLYRTRVDDPYQVA